MSYERACIVIQSTISDYAYPNPEEQVDYISNSEEMGGAISNSGEQVNTESEEKAYSDYILKTSLKP